LITGGSGFLGRQIVAKVREAGHRVWAPRSDQFNLDTVSTCMEYFETLGCIDVLIHSAAYYGGIGINQAEPATIIYKNLRMATTVFEIARKLRVKKIIPIGSACAYPGHLQGDLKESRFWDGALHDSVEAYGITKKIQLVLQRAYYKQHGIESNHLILTNLYGPHDVFTEYRSHVLSALIKKFADAVAQNSDKVTLWGDGSPIREFLYVEDAADAIVKTIEAKHDLSPINIGTGVGTSIKQLAELIKEIVGFRGDIIWDTTKPNGAKRKVLSIYKVSMKLEWKAKTTLKAGLLKTISWYLQNKESADARQ
ncbi:unnamed protein product, partial [marine sediment metagenome]